MSTARSPSPSALSGNGHEPDSEADLALDAAILDYGDALATVVQLDHLGAQATLALPPEAADSGCCAQVRTLPGPDRIVGAAP